MPRDQQQEGLTMPSEQPPTRVERGRISEQPREEGRGFTREELRRDTYLPGKDGALQPATARGEGDDLAARLDALAQQHTDAAYGGSIDTQDEHLAAAHAFREAAQLARASTHPEQSERIVGAALDLLDSLGAPHYHDLIGMTYTLRKEQADNLRAALEPASPTPTEQGEGRVQFIKGNAIGKSQARIVSYDEEPAPEGEGEAS